MREIAKQKNKCANKLRKAVEFAQNAVSQNGKVSAKEIVSQGFTKSYAASAIFLLRLPPVYLDYFLQKGWSHTSILRCAALGVSPAEIETLHSNAVLPPRFTVAQINADAVKIKQANS